MLNVMDELEATRYLRLGRPDRRIVRAKRLLSPIATTTSRSSVRRRPGDELLSRDHTRAALLQPLPGDDVHRSRATRLHVRVIAPETGVADPEHLLPVRFGIRRGDTGVLLHNVVTTSPSILRPPTC